MACGKSLLLFDIEPHREIIEISNAGKIFSFKKDLDFMTVLDTVYANLDSNKISALKFAKSHDWKLITRQLMAIFEKLD